MEMSSKVCSKYIICYAILIIFVTSVEPKIYSRQQILRALARHPPRRDYDYIDFDSSIEEELVSSRLRDRYPEFFRKDDYTSLLTSGTKATRRTDSNYGVSKGVSAGGKLFLVLLPFLMLPFMLLPIKLFIIFKMFVAGKMALLSAVLAKVLSKPKYFKKHFKKRGKKCKGALLALIPIVLIGLLLGSLLSGLIAGVVSGIISGIITLVNSTITNSTTTTNNGNNGNNGNNNNAAGKGTADLYVIPEMSLGYSNNRYSYKAEKFVANDNNTSTDTCLLATEDFRDMSKNEIRILMNLLERKYSKEPWVTCNVRE